VITRFSLGSIIFLIPVVVSAQLTLYPIHQSNQQKTIERQKSHLEPMSLPFWDDFSTPTHTDTLWDDKANVWINAGAAIKPPTINVATFDGVNGAGVAYAPNPNQNLDVGPTDVMVSRRIKMTEVPVAGQNDIFLSFYYQWGGSVEPPDTNDKLELQFLDEDGNWDLRATFQATALQQPDSFYYYTIRINQGDYIHDDFQFRFQAYGRQSGKFDSWHIDYVYLNKNRTETDSSYPDRAISTPPNGIFERYHAIPIRQIPSTSNLSPPKFEVKNLKKTETVLSFNSEATFINFRNGVEIIHSELFDIATPINEDNTGEIGGNARKTVRLKEFPPSTSDTIYFNSQADSIQIDLKLSLDTKDNVILTNNGDYDPILYDPIDFRNNDTIHFTYKLRDYYAYDDGIAEYAVGLAGNGNVAAYRFEMLTPDPDTINGVYVHFANSYGTFASTVTFYVWDDDNGRPGDLLLEELVPVQRNSNNEFVLRPFIQSALVQGTFYIGWEQPSAGRVLIGLDANNETGDQLYINTAGLNNPNTWTQNVLIKGSLMIRPRFGLGEVTSSAESGQPKRISIYPNPNRGEFFIDGKATHLQVFTSSGYSIPVETFQEEENKTRIRMTRALPGLYIARYFDGDSFQSQKIIIQE
jgi:hypothetical protein